MDTVTSLWVVAILAVATTLIGIVLLTLIPSCASRLKKSKLLQPVSNVSENGRFQSTIFHLNDDKRTESNSINAIIGTVIGGTSKKFQERHNPTLDQNVVLKKTKSLLTKIDNCAYVLFGHFIIMGILFISILAYPPSLWFIWGFFPSNSVTVSIILYTGLKTTIDIGTLFFIKILSRMVIRLASLATHNANSNAVLEEYTKWLLVYISFPTGLQILLFIALGLRTLFLYIGTNVLWFDGVNLFALVVILDLLWIIIHFYIAAD